MDNTSNSPAGTIFGDIAEQNLPPEAAAALKQYAEIQSAQAALNDELRPLLKASPLDWDAIELITEKKEKLHQQRKDALEILALYSDEAFNELQATIAREKNLKDMAELDRETKSTKQLPTLLERFQHVLGRVQRYWESPTRFGKRKQALHLAKQVLLR